MAPPLVLLAACSRADSPAPAPSAAHRMDLRYGILGPCDSPDPLEACAQTALGSLALDVRTQHTYDPDAGGSRIRVGVVDRIEAIEACHREGAARDPALACTVSLVLEPPHGSTPRRFLLDRRQPSCPPALASCIETAFASLTAPGDMATPQGPPEIVLSLSPGDRPRLPKTP